MPVPDFLETFTSNHYKEDDRAELERYIVAVKELKAKIKILELERIRSDREKKLENELLKADREILTLGRELDTIKEEKEYIETLLCEVRRYVEIAINISENNIETHVEYGRYWMTKEIDSIAHGKNPSAWRRKK